MKHQLFFALSFLRPTVAVALACFIAGATAAPPALPKVGTGAAIPPLDRYAPLWTASLLTSHRLSNGEPASAGFADNLSLAGIYEVDGRTVAVLMDRTSGRVTEACSGMENETGIRIRQITPGQTPQKTKVELVLGNETGWVTFPAEHATAAAPTASAAPGSQGASPTQSAAAVTPVPQTAAAPAAVPQTNAPAAPVASRLPAQPTYPNIRFEPPKPVPTSADVPQR